MANFQHPGLLPAGDSVLADRMPRPAVALVFWVALLFWAAGILWLSSMTPQELPEASFLFSDKFNHFVAFAVGAWLAAGALQGTRPQTSTMARLVAAIMLIAAFGAFDEALQKFTPGRTGGDLYDWIADFLGATAGALFSLTTHGFIFRSRPRP